MNTTTAWIFAACILAESVIVLIQEVNLGRLRARIRRLEESVEQKAGGGAVSVDSYRRPQVVKWGK